MNRHHGFSLLEVTIAMALTLLVAGAAFALLDPAAGAFAAVPEVSDLQQRLRVVADTLNGNLMLAGAGPHSGPAAGSLLALFAPVLPYRVGAIGYAPPGSYTSDTITLLSVPYPARQTTISVPVVAGNAALRVNTGPACPRDADGLPVPLCGFAPGTSLLVVDPAGRHDVFTVSGIAGDTAALTVHKPAAEANAIYPPGSVVVEVVHRTYAVRAGATSNASQLVSYDGADHPDVPVADDVVGIGFEYFGDPQPPAALRPDEDPVGAWTTYGPRPPPPGVNTTAYPEGENCTFARDGNGRLVPRLAPLEPSSSLVRLTVGQLTDGPWCPDSISPDRYDADLLRIRAIAVTLRLQAAIESLRGPAGVLFRHAGTATDSRRWVPDREIQFMIAPRNLNPGR